MCCKLQLFVSMIDIIASKKPDISFTVFVITRNMNMLTSEEFNRIIGQYLIRFILNSGHSYGWDVFCLGWAIAAEEREWKYRLSIYYTKPQDTGVFTCQTPRGLTNSLNVQVLGESCVIKSTLKN